jgi:WD40 repeat protein
MTKNPSRRAVLKRGLAAGAALLTGDTLLAGCGSLRQGAASGSSMGEDKHMLLALLWQGIDYAWLPDSAHLAYVSNRGLFIVDTKSGSQIWRQKVWPHYTYRDTRAVSWSANGARVVSTAASAFLVQDVQTGLNIWSHHDDRSTLLAAALSPDGTLLALAQASSSALMQIWDVQERKLVAQCSKPGGQPQDESETQNILWSPDGTRIVTTSLSGAVHIWQAASGRLLRAHDNQHMVALSWSPDGAALAFAAIGAPGEALLGIWDVESGQTRFQTPASVSVEIQQAPRANPVAWSPDGARVAFIAQDHNAMNVEVWSVRRGQRLFTCQSVSGEPTGITWSPDGRYLAAGDAIVGSGMLADGNNGENSVVQFWDANDGRALFTYSAPKSPDRLAWSPDGRYLALITPRVYGILPDKTCLSLCRYGYEDTTFEIFQVA